MPKGYIIAELTVTSPGPEFDEYREKVQRTEKLLVVVFLSAPAIRNYSKELVRQDAR